jgi:hypothetical protein
MRRDIRGRVGGDVWDGARRGHTGRRIHGRIDGQAGRDIRMPGGGLGQG